MQISKLKFTLLHTSIPYLYIGVQRAYPLTNTRRGKHSLIDLDDDIYAHPTLMLPIQNHVHALAHTHPFQFPLQRLH